MDNKNDMGGIYIGPRAVAILALAGLAVLVYTFGDMAEVVTLIEAIRGIVNT